MDAAAAPAAVLRAADADDPQAGRHPVQHLAHRFADRMQGATTTGAGRHIEVEVHVLALKMLGQAWPIRSVLDRGLFGGGSHRQQFLDPGDVGTQVFQAQLQLVAIKPLGAPAELQALQLLHDQPQPFDLGLRLGESLAFARSASPPAHGSARCRASTSSGRAARSTSMPRGYACSRPVASGSPIAESIGRMGVSLRYPASCRPPPSAPASASRCPRSASTAAPWSASPSRWPRPRQARRTGSAPASW